MPDATSPFSAYERNQLSQIQNFLANITEPKIGYRAAMVGYDNAEHEYGWQQWGVAMGITRPFTHYLSASMQQIVIHNLDRMKGLLPQIDAFENKWLPRTRSTIRRYVDPVHAAVVEAAFFANLEQQPEGPEVIGSVSLFVERFEALPQSNVPGVKEAHAALVKRGLDQQALELIKQLLDAAKKPAEQLPAPEVSAAEQEAAATAQRTAYDKLKLWYNDWAETLREELTYHQSVRLGIRRQKGGRKSTEEETGSTGVAETDE